MALNLNLASGYHLPEIASALKSYVAATGKPDTLGLTPSDTSAPPDTGPPPPDNAPPPGAPLINALPEEAQPIPIAPVDPNAAPTPGAVPTESSGDRAARAAKESFYDFENNPVGSLGRAMAQFAAGYRGDPNSGPLAQFDKQKLEERAMQYKQVEFGMNFLDKAIPLIEAAPPDQKLSVAQHLQESVGGTIGHDFMPLLTAVANGQIKGAADSLKAIQSYITDPKLAALITSNPKLIDVFGKAISEAQGKAAGEPEKTYDVPAGAVVIGAKGNIIFDNRKGGELKTYKLSPGEVVKDEKGNVIARGDAKAPEKPESPSVMLERKIAAGETLTEGDQKLLETLHPGATFDAEAAAPSIKAVANYDQAPPTGRYALTPAGIKFMEGVHAQNPDYNSTKFPSKQQARKNWLSGGTSGRPLVALNRAAQHLDTFQELTAALNSKNVIRINQARQRFETEFGKAAPGNVVLAAKILGPEILKTILGQNTLGTAEERKDLSDSFNRINSPAQIAGAVQTAQKFIGAQAKAAELAYHNDTGDMKPETFRGMLVPESLKILDAASAPAAALPAGVTEADIQHTMKVNNVSREQVLQRLGAP